MEISATLPVYHINSVPNPKIEHTHRVVRVHGDHWKEFTYTYNEHGTIIESVVRKQPLAEV